MRSFFVLIYIRNMIEKYSIDPPKGLFDKIILVIKQEQEIRQTRRILFSFLFLFIASLIATPVSWTILVNQAGRSGITYFIATAASDLGTFFVLWQDFSLAILESLPIMGVVLFIISVSLVLFTLRLFLHKKGLMLGYLIHKPA